MLMQLAWSHARPEWAAVFGGKPHTIGTLSMNNVSVVEEIMQPQRTVSSPLRTGVSSRSVALATT